jgi:Phage T7 tail fibre protein
MSTLTQQLYSQSHWLADGTQTVWNFSFSGGYISRDHVKAYTRGPLEDDPRVDLVITPESFIGDFQILIEPAVTVDHTLIIYRDTPKDLPLVDFADGANINEVSLDTVAKQAVFVAAESADFLGVTTTADLAELAATAIANAGAAAASAANALTHANTAGTQAGNAAVSASASAASAVAASNSATAASAAVTSAINAVLANFASVASASLGAGLVGYRGPQSAPADTVAERLSWDIYVTDPQFNAVNDGATDSTTQLAAAVTYANSLCDVVSDSLDVARFPRLIFPPGLGFRTTATLSIRAGVAVIMHSPLFVVAVAGTPIIGMRLVDAKAVDYQAPRLTHSVFDIRRVTQSTWPGETDIGLLVDAHYAGRMDVKRITGFHVGFDVCAGYEEIHLGEIRDCKIGMLVKDRSSPADQFTNQTHFHGGSIVCAGTNAGISRYGIEVRSVMGGINSLAFYGQSYELGLATATSGNPSGEAIPMVVNGTAFPIADISATDQRSETNSVTFLRATGDVSHVVVGVINQVTEYSDSTELMLDDDSTGSGGIVVYRQGGATAPVWETFFDTGRLVERVVQLTGGVVTIQNLECATSVGAAPATQTFTYGDYGPVFDASGFMTCAGPLYGVRVRLNGARSIPISGRKPTSTAANLKIICFDSSGTQLTSTDLVQFDGTSATVNTGIYGGVYSLGIVPSNTAKTFNAVIGFASNVATAFISVESATDGWVLKRSDARPEWFSASGHLRNQFVGAAIPIALTNVTYTTGMRVAQITPAVGSPKGWMLDSGGTWRSEGNL